MREAHNEIHDNNQGVETMGQAFDKDGAILGEAYGETCECCEAIAEGSSGLSTMWTGAARFPCLRDLSVLLFSLLSSGEM